MKIFWSWQSDTPGKIGRHFVRDALTAAIERLKQKIDVTEPTERELRSNIHIDHDRKSVAGSPDLARTILEKIAGSAVVIADVTPVGMLTDELRSEEDPPKRLINSNVAIELGYALHTLSDRALLMVMNEHYGNRNDLPFDLRHKAGPITFRLDPKASKQDITKASSNLISQLCEALELCLTEHLESQRLESKKISTVSAIGPATFFERGEVLATVGHRGEQQFSVDNDKIAFLNLLVPNNSPPVSLTDLVRMFESRRPKPFLASQNANLSGIPTRNKYGAVTFDYEGTGTITGLTQGFPGGELWGVNARIIREHQFNDAGRPTYATVIPMIAFEKLYTTALRNYLDIAKLFGFQPPFTARMGAVGLSDAYIIVPGGPFGNGEHVGPIMTQGIQRSYQISETSEAVINGTLREFFIQFYDLAACSRRDVLTPQIVTTHGLPPL